MPRVIRLTGVNLVVEGETQTLQLVVEGEPQVVGHHVTDRFADIVVDEGKQATQNRGAEK